ncbi:hypothetical protein [Streptomyces sp. NPDC055632]
MAAAPAPLRAWHGTHKRLLDSRILPALESRRINSFSPTVDDFTMSMEERKVGLATQQNAFDTLKKILLDARRRGGITDAPFQILSTGARRARRST